MTNAVLLRFVRTFVAGAVAGMVTYTVQTQSTAGVTDISVWLHALLVAGIAAGLVALDKALRYTNA